MLPSTDSLVEARDAVMRERGAHPYALHSDPAPITAAPGRGPSEETTEQERQRLQDERAVDAVIALFGLPLARSLHCTHALSLLDRTAFCRQCGYTASATAGLAKSGLDSLCKGEPPNTGAACRLRRMFDGKHPKTGDRLDSRAVPVPKLLLWKTALQGQHQSA